MPAPTATAATTRSEQQQQLLVDTAHNHGWQLMQARKAGGGSCARTIGWACCSANLPSLSIKGMCSGGLDCQRLDQSGVLSGHSSSVCTDRRPGASGAGLSIPTTGSTRPPEQHNATEPEDLKVLSCKKCTSPTAGCTSAACYLWYRRVVGLTTTAVHPTGDTPSTTNSE